MTEKPLFGEVMGKRIIGDTRTWYIGNHNIEWQSYDKKTLLISLWARADTITGYNGFTAVLSLLILMLGSVCDTIIIRELTHPLRRYTMTSLSRFTCGLSCRNWGRISRVMAWVMLFGVVVPEVGASMGPVNIEVAQAGAIPDRVESHVDRLFPFLLYCTICKTHWCGVIYLHGSGGLGMSDFLESRVDWLGVFRI